MRVALLLVVLFLLGQQVSETRAKAKGLQQYDAAPLQQYRVLSTDPYLSIHGRDPVLLDSFLTTILEKEKKWSPAPVLADISRQTFDVVFLAELNHAPMAYRSVNLMSPTILEKLRSNYRPVCRKSPDKFCVASPFLPPEISTSEPRIFVFLRGKCGLDPGKTLV